MLLKENSKKPVFLVALAFSFILSLLFLQRRHDLSLPKSVGQIAHSVTKAKSDLKDAAPPSSKQTKLPEASIKALQNETLGVGPQLCFASTGN